ncbi:hypothetical protein BcepSauron_058 [Burkholderia phage BcepSauron]|uniref:Uncharacterized protein n=2 Tax=Sarumanvirus TaxID=2843450 RepID=A0A482MLE0_9CAUD|nr:hypothetical protein H1O16_gp058 [Burkholderia phage BcepSaruman]YP_009904436.1 hypothetical protein H1O17_gp058 [Burkholderia phage BcepSauron]QBQ74438.1 hypothetical protein BcepSauron_058 [Burkholderia phage BcepSauron]QBX06471.1 hypothetical protein BcepSaruman_058 [Burkholderia phage BcepSaruman]
MSDLDLSADIINVSDICDRYDELKDERDTHDSDDDRAADWADENPDEAVELEQLEKILTELNGEGGDHQYEGNWYPGCLIRDSHFTEYCEQLVSDIGDMPREIPSYLVIDWDATAKNLSVDYSTIDIEGTEYLYR